MIASCRSPSSSAREYVSIDIHVVTDIPFVLSPDDKPLVWLRGEVTTPPFSREARREAGFLLRMLQSGEKLSMPQSRPMPSVGRRCHELRIPDLHQSWRILYRVDDDAILILHVFSKKGRRTPKAVIDVCKETLKRYDVLSGLSRRLK